jgi:hypothetical protein
VIRKYTLEALRRRSAMGGYIITGLRDTPISTSGVWDDLGRAKWPEDEYYLTNGPDILCLDADRRRTWRHGGDRPDPIDPYTFSAPGRARWHVILPCSTRDFPAPAALDWEIRAQAERVIYAGSSPVNQAVSAGRPARIATLAWDIPAFTQAEMLTLVITLRAGDRRVTNTWPVWVYPQAALPAGAARCDPPGLLSGWGDPLANLPTLAQGQRPAVLVTTAWDAAVQAIFADGGKILLLQPGDGPLPARRLPFWREAIKIFTPHPIWQGFPHAGFTGMQFFGIAGDVAFDPQRIRAILPAAAEYRPLLRRLDAREFHVTDYIFEARAPGGGLLIGCSLPLNGGAGAQPSGLRRNIAGAALLSAMLGCL